MKSINQSIPLKTFTVQQIGTDLILNPEFNE